MQLMNIQTILEQNKELKNADPSPYQQMVHAKKPLNVKQQQNLPTKLREAELISLKTNEKLIVQLMTQIIDLGFELINDELRKQLTDTYLGIKQGLKIESKPVCFLLKKFGYDLEALVEQRIQQNP